MCNRRVVSYVVNNQNDNPLVFPTFGIRVPEGMACVKKSQNAIGICAAMVYNIKYEIFSLFY